MSPDAVQDSRQRVRSSGLKGITKPVKRPVVRSITFHSFASTHFVTLSMANRPDRPLVVKCRFGGARKKISFHSSKNCTYGELRRKVTSFPSCPRVQC